MSVLIKKFSLAVVVGMFASISAIPGFAFADSNCYQQTQEPGQSIVRLKDGGGNCYEFKGELNKDIVLKSEVPDEFKNASWAVVEVCAIGVAEDPNARYRFTYRLIQSPNTGVTGGMTKGYVRASGGCNRAAFFIKSNFDYIEVQQYKIQ